MNAMMHVIPKSGSRKVNGYVKAVLALEVGRRKREDRYARVGRPLDRKRDALAAEVATRAASAERRATRRGPAAARDERAGDSERRHCESKATASDGTANRG